jgi:hypothetical protein
MTFTVPVVGLQKTNLRIPKVMGMNGSKKITARMILWRWLICSFQRSGIGMKIRKTSHAMSVPAEKRKTRFDRYMSRGVWQPCSPNLKKVPGEPQAKSCRKMVMR